MKDRLSEEKQAEIIAWACRINGLDGHIKWIKRNLDCNTWAEKIADRFRKKEFPVKNSFMFCETLDMCFFFEPKSGLACMTYAGYAYAGSNDIKENLKIAFSKADHILTMMQERAKREEKELRRKHEENIYIMPDEGTH